MVLPGYIQACARGVLAIVQIEMWSWYQTLDAGRNTWTDDLHYQPHWIWYCTKHVSVWRIAVAFQVSSQCLCAHVALIHWAESVAGLRIVKQLQTSLVLNSGECRFADWCSLLWFSGISTSGEYRFADWCFLPWIQPSVNAALHDCHQRSNNFKRCCLCAALC